MYVHTVCTTGNIFYSVLSVLAYHICNYYYIVIILPKSRPQMLSIMHVRMTRYSISVVVSSSPSLFRR